MITFALLALALIASILSFVLVPLLRRQHIPVGAFPAPSSDASLDRLNISIYRDQLRELDDDLAAGTLDHQQHAEARSELERRLLEDTAGSNAVPEPAPPRAGKWTAIMLAAIIPLGVIGLYLIVGTPQGIAPQQSLDAARNITPEQLEQMIAKLAARMKASPDDGEG